MSYQEGIETGAEVYSTQAGETGWIEKATETVVATFLEAAGTPIQWCEVHVIQVPYTSSAQCWRALDHHEATPCRIVSMLLVEPKEEPQ